MALPWVPQWEEKAEGSHCEFSLPPQVQLSQFVHPAPRHRTLDVIHKQSLAESQISSHLLPFPLLLILAAHLKVDVGIPAAQNKGALPFLPPPALCWVLRHHTELILISCLNSPCVLAVLCHQTVTSVLGRERLARGQASRETRVIVIIYYYIFTGQKRCLQHAEPQGCKDLLNRHIWCWENFHQQDLGPNRQVSNEGYWCFWGLRSFASPPEGERGCFLFGVSWHFLVPDRFQQYSVPKAGSKTYNSSNQVHVGM